MSHAPTEEDSNNEFNARERAALALRLPDSGNPWLDEMIAKARQLDTATAIECAYLACIGKDDDGLTLEPVEHLNGLASIASEMADALLDEVLTEPRLI